MTGGLQYGRPAAGVGPQPANLADLLERILDKGLVIAGDITISLVDVELLTIKLRLLVASADKAAEMGIDWWRHDPHLNGSSRRMEEENQELRRRLTELERVLAAHPGAGGGQVREASGAGAPLGSTGDGGADAR